jgi:hypothetical protein
LQRGAGLGRVPGSNVSDFVGKRDRRFFPALWRIDEIQKGKRIEVMTAIQAHDLHDYFELFEQYQQTKDPVLASELDKRLSRYKDRFHEDSEAVLDLLRANKDSFLDRFEASYNDLLFDIQLHAQSMEDIKRTHTYDAERKVWVPKGSKEG